MHRLIITLPALLAMLCGMAQAKEYTVETGDFHEFTVVNGINVIYKHNPDSAGKAVFKCNPQIAEAITFSNKDMKLKLEVVSETPLRELPTVTIYSYALDKVTNWSDSTITVEKVNPGVHFRAKVVGNGDITALNVLCTKAEASVQAGNGHIFITGKCQEAKYNIMSAGAIEGGNMAANKVRCTLTGTGSIDCNASEELKISGIGSGTVYYTGTPKVSNKGLGIKVQQAKTK